MIYSEQLKKAGGSIEVRHNNDEAVYVFIKNGKNLKRRLAKVFPTMEQMIANVYLGINTEHFTLPLDDLHYLYCCQLYGYHALKNYYDNKPAPNQLNLFEQ